MTTNQCVSRDLDRAFDRFLQVPTDRGDGQETTILSLLARLDHDPWHVARQLAGMPRAQAVGYITHIVDGPGHGTPSFSAQDMDAWIDLLPRSPGTSASTGIRGRPTLGLLFIGFNALFFMLLCLSLATPMPSKNTGGDASHASPSPGPGRR